MARASAAFSTWATLLESKDTKVVGYQCKLGISLNDWGLLAADVHHHSPIEGFVRLMLEHLIEIFKGFHLSCCLKVIYKCQIVTFFFKTWEHLFTRWWIKQGCIVTLVSDSLLVTVGSERISAKTSSISHEFWCGEMIVLFAESTRSYLWVSTCDLMTSGPAWIWDDSPAGSCCPVAPPLYRGKWWTGPSQNLDWQPRCT